MPNYRYQIRPFTLPALFWTCFEQVCLNRHRIHPVSVSVDQDFGKCWLLSVDCYLLIVLPPLDSPLATRPSPLFPPRSQTQPLAHSRTRSTAAARRSFPSPNQQFRAPGMGFNWWTSHHCRQFRILNPFWTLCPIRFNSWTNLFRFSNSFPHPVRFSNNFPSLLRLSNYLSSISEPRTEN